MGYRGCRSEGVDREQSLRTGKGSSGLRIMDGMGLNMLPVSVDIVGHGGRRKGESLVELNAQLDLEGVQAARSWREHAWLLTNDYVRLTCAALGCVDGEIRLHQLPSPVVTTGGINAPRLRFHVHISALIILVSSFRLITTRSFFRSVF